MLCWVHEITKPKNSDRLVIPSLSGVPHHDIGTDCRHLVSGV